MEQYNAVIEELFEYSLAIRYVAFYCNDILISKQRNTLSNSTASESDRMEEILVNPTLLLLARQRGNIDCGGLRYIVVAYGNFYQLISEIKNGHLSICLDQACDVTSLSKNILEFLRIEHPGIF